MTLILLIDLDDTLLINNMDQFLKHYFRELSTALARFVAPDQMMAAMSKAVNKMLSKQDPAGTLENAFNQSFYPSIGISRSELSSVIDEFYKTQFPRLKSLTSERPEASELISRAFERGWQVVIATNPLFPATAIRQRIDWAGLNPEVYPFCWITDFEKSHFCKPNPAYYAEILATLRWPEGPIVMVGNDLNADILPAEAIGIPTFWLCEDMGSDFQYQRQDISSHGDFKQLNVWLDMVEQSVQSPKLETISGLKSTLLATPAAISTFTIQLGQKLWNERPAPNEWSLTEILCHLRDVDRDVNIQRIHAVLNGSNPFIPGAVTDPWVDERDYAAECGQDSLNGFIEVRSEIVQLLESITEENWQKPARHAIFGPTNLKELINFTATHDKTHTRQAWETIQTVMGKLKQKQIL